MDINKKIKIFGKPLINHKAIFIVLTAILCVFTLVNVVNVALSFVQIDGNIEIVGDSRYDDVEIKKATRLRGSDFWLAVDTKELEERLLYELKFLDTVKVTKIFPNKIKISVTAKTPRWYIDISGKKWALDSDMEVIDEIYNTEGVTKLCLPEISRVISGEVPVFSKDSQTTVKETLKILDTVRTNDIRKRLTALDIKDRTHIKLEIDGKYTANLGNTDELTRKLNMINALLEEEQVKNAKSGEFNFVDGEAAFREYK